MNDSTLQVVGWQKAYCGAMALLYLLLVVAGVVMVALAGMAPKPEDRVALVVQGLIMAIMCTPLAGLFGAGLVLPPRPWVWVYHLVLICIGLTSPCCMPASIPLLIFWIKPETRAYFGRT